MQLRELASNKTLAYVCTAVAILAWGTLGNAQEREPPHVPSGAITGTVTSESTHGPLAKATVQLEELDRIVETDADGRFSFAGVAPGTYRLLVSHAAYVPSYRTDVVVTAARDTQVAIALVDLPARSESIQVTASA